MNKEWYNSLYTFNKNSVRFLPSIYNYTFKLIKSYFNMTNSWMENKIQSRKYKNFQRLSGKKLWVSNPEIKHFNEKMNITIYIYNRTYNFYKKKLDLFNFTWGPNTSVKKHNKFYKKKPRFFAKLAKFRSIKRELPLYIGRNKTTCNKSYNQYIKTIKWLKLDKYTHMVEYRSNIIDLIKNNENKQIENLLKDLKTRHYDYLINQFNKELTYLKFKQIMLYNKFKFNELYLISLVEFLQTIYKKKIEWNIVTLKYYYLSTSILLQIIEKKIKNPKFRGKYLLPVDSGMEKIRTPILSRNRLAGEKKVYIGVQNEKVSTFFSKDQDDLNQFLLVNKKSKIWADKNIDGLVLSNLENKTISGMFIKIAGRLTRRYRADRALETLRFKGTLKNVYSAHRNLSSSLSRGYSNINIEKVRIDSKIRIGAFGLTGWMASY